MAHRSTPLSGGTALTIATMPARIASGNTGQAVTAAGSAPLPPRGFLGVKKRGNENPREVDPGA